MIPTSKKRSRYSFGMRPIDFSTLLERSDVESILPQGAKMNGDVYQGMNVFNSAFPLSDQPNVLESWSAWQFHDPRERSGFIQTFRTETLEDRHRFVVRGPEQRACYRFSDVYSAESFDVPGSQAMTLGIEITQAPMSSRVLAYEKITA